LLLKSFSEEEVIQRFYDKIDKVENGCWMWTGWKFKDGYGGFNVRRRTVRAHRWAYKYFVGPIPEGMCVCHKCDNPACVNPDHLWIGTNIDNMRDEREKGRTPNGDRNGKRTCPEKIIKGIKVGVPKITEMDVKEIRAMCGEGYCYKEIAKKFGISPGSISKIKFRVNWKQVE
jgi:hypothetical protein